MSRKSNLSHTKTQLLNVPSLLFVLYQRLPVEKGRPTVISLYHPRRIVPPFGRGAVAERNGAVT